MNVLQDSNRIDYSCHFDQLGFSRMYTWQLWNHNFQKTVEKLLIFDQPIWIIDKYLNKIYTRVQSEKHLENKKFI